MLLLLRRLEAMEARVLQARALVAFEVGMAGRALRDLLWGDLLNGRLTKPIPI